MSPSRQLIVRVASFLLASLLLRSGNLQATEAPGTPLYALIVGGGPDVSSNAAQIEGHVHFIAGTLPAATRRIVLFADGQAAHETVAHADLSADADAKRAVAILLNDKDASEPILLHAPKLGVPLDGPSRLQDVHRALGKLSTQAAHEPAPLLLYFAGHGTQDEKDETDTAYDLWDGDALKVHALATEVARLPRTVPVVLVMAQCFSGAFADLLFRNGDPKGALAEVNLAGFFSTRKDREAAGCSYATSQKDYQDFSSYFFGALSGRDRFGHAVDGADFDHDGTVSLHEAFCYALIHDPSADTPMCTSDVFLKRFAPLPDAAIFGTSYTDVYQAGTPAQRAALDALSVQLGLEGEMRALTVYDRFTYSDPAVRAEKIKNQAEAKEKLNALCQTTLAALFEHWPALRWGGESREYDKARDGATREIAHNPILYQAVNDAETAHEQADGTVESEEAALQRFASLYANIVEARYLRVEGKEETKAQFERLWKAEQRVLPTR